MDIQTKIGSPIQELSFQNESREQCHVDFYRFENTLKCAPSPVSVNPKFCIMHPSREKMVAIVYTRTSYPSPKRVRDLPRDLMHLLYVILNKKHESHIRPCLEISKKSSCKFFPFPKVVKKFCLLMKKRFWQMKYEILAI